MIQIVPAILSTNEEDFIKDLEKISSAQSFQEGRLHIDFMDNKFVPNQSIGVDVVARHPIRLSTQAHLMVESPLEWLSELRQSGFETVIFHAECRDYISAVLDKAREYGLRTGLAVKHQTPLEEVEKYYDRLDEILLMAIEPGFQGQPFIPEALDKISRLAKIKQEKGYKFLISVDGHVNDETADGIIKAGADILIIGSYLLKGYPDENVEKLWEILNK